MRNNNKILSLYFAALAYLLCLSGCTTCQPQDDGVKNGMPMVRVSGDVTVTAAGRDGFRK